ncbi:hypothetical protein [Thiocapsa bogorovii]|uniref:hypothetical protein n=1 Tax=Thiocapsa bogorovii TaxID=521689 RepID=UPI001E4C6BB1|nr:hypothetical protein [Thiocapsa bogorovii]UHD17796.1 hypothetical protein LT988_07040 [Thiocapsa bogorovii]
MGRAIDFTAIAGDIHTGSEQDIWHEYRSNMVTNTDAPARDSDTSSQQDSS